MESDGTARPGQSWVVELGYVGARGTHLRETRDGIQSVDAIQDPVVTDTKWPVIHHHHQHFRKRDCADADSWPERLQRVSTFRQRCLLDLPRIAGDAESRDGERVTSRELTHSRKTSTRPRPGIPHSTPLTTIKAAWMLREDFGLRPASSFNGQLCLRSAFLCAYLGAKASGVFGGWQISGETIFQSGAPFSIFDSGAGTAFWAGQHSFVRRQPGPRCQHIEWTFERRHSSARSMDI